MLFDKSVSLTVNYTVKNDTTFLQAYLWLEEQLLGYLDR